MVDIRLMVLLAAALLVGAVVGGLVGHYSVPRIRPTVSAVVVRTAQCELQGPTDPSRVRGTIIFSRSGAAITVNGIVNGLSRGRHGLHVHQVGSTADRCAAARGHFNPFGKHHGAPSASMRHVGDLGNIVADMERRARINITDTQLQFAGDAGILGRAVVIHSGEDDLGLEGHSDSLTAGHAGARLACCVIGVVN